MVIVSMSLAGMAKKLGLLRGRLEGIDATIGQMD